jgi:hypothetical protein
VRGLTAEIRRTAFCHALNWTPCIPEPGQDHPWGQKQTVERNEFKLSRVRLAVIVD